MSPKLITQSQIVRLISDARVNPKTIRPALEQLDEWFTAGSLPEARYTSATTVIKGLL